MLQSVESNSLSFLEPACPLCFEPFSTEAPDLDDGDDGDRRPVLRHSGRSVCACCHAEGVFRHHPDKTCSIHASPSCMTAPLDYNLIDHIIFQQHRRAACVPAVNEQEQKLLRRFKRSPSSSSTRSNDRMH